MNKLNTEGYKLFEQASRSFLAADNIITRAIQRLAYGTDASFYRLVPQLVLRIETQTQLIKVIELASQYQLSLTFRAAGTSLSGQAITDSILIILSTAWEQLELLNEGEQIKLQPGVIGARANRALLPFDRKIGPDPASINSCKIGGIAANNASGMCCGVKNNSYHTLAAIKLIFADASILDTADSHSRMAYLNDHQEQISQLQALAKTIKQSPELLARVKHKYRLKNTTGYGINALIDFDDPIDIISHLMIGSEGTLAFIADITYQTIAIKKYKYAGLYLFDQMNVACQLVEQLAHEHVDAVEILDDRALNSVANSLSELLEFTQAGKNTAALLIEFSANSENELKRLLTNIQAHITPLNAHLLPSRFFTKDQQIITKLWQIRKGMFPAVGANRTIGTTVVIEDIALPLNKLAEGVTRLHQLFDRFAYDEAIIFGHALAGNLHFVFTQSFDHKQEIQRYRDFMAAVSQMVAVDFQGSLKAEHGTGRNMAPFVELEWGTDLYEIMKQIKQLFDPKGIFNDGVIINKDKNCHINHLKTMPAANQLIDKCIECGFCEPVCPSANLTLTPRQRITVWRRICELQRLQQQGQLTHQQAQELKNLVADYQYFGLDSCAATGLCGQQCPVDIDTGVFIKHLRAQKLAKNGCRDKVANLFANNFAAMSAMAKIGLNTVNLMSSVGGDKLTSKAFSTLNLLSKNNVPKWYSAWPSAAKSYNTNLMRNSFTQKVVYIPSCANRIFAVDNKAKDQRPLAQVLQSILSKSQLEMIIPSGINTLCCGMPWASKGMNKIAEQKRQGFIDLMEQASEGGKWPVITDASPCAFAINSKELSTLKVYEASEFIAKFVLDKLVINKSLETFMLHVTCSSKKMDQGIYLEQIVRACSDHIVVPDNINCCGFAGDKGFYQPELNKHALKTLAAQVPDDCRQGLSNSRTCEIGLSEHSRISYQSFLYLLDQVSQ